MDSLDRIEYTRYYFQRMSVNHLEPILKDNRMFRKMTNCFKLTIDDNPPQLLSRNLHGHVYRIQSKRKYSAAFVTTANKSTTIELTKFLDDEFNIYMFKILLLRENLCEDVVNYIRSIGI